MDGCVYVSVVFYPVQAEALQLVDFRPKGFYQGLKASRKFGE
jgi:hypothetical protein